MSLDNYKITQDDIETKGVVAAPDVVSGDPKENKKIFDRLIREAVAVQFNALIDELKESGVEMILRRGDDSIQYIRLNEDKVLEVSTDGVEYEATGSSGHTILDANGNTLPQRGKLQFPDGSVEDIAGVTVVKSIGGIPVGEKGKAGGVAGLDATGKVPAAQLPEKMTPAAHAASHKKGGSDPLTAADIDALSTNGGQLNGALLINMAKPEIVMRLLNDSRYADIFMGSSGLLNIQNRVDNNNFQSVYLNKETASVENALQIERIVDGAASYYKFYHTGSITAGTTDLTAGTSSLNTGCIYQQYQ